MSKVLISVFFLRYFDDTQYQFQAPKIKSYIAKRQSLILVLLVAIQIMDRSHGLPQ